MCNEIREWGRKVRQQQSCADNCP